MEAREIVESGARQESPQWEKVHYCWGVPGVEVYCSNWYEQGQTTCEDWMIELDVVYENNLDFQGHRETKKKLTRSIRL